MRAAVIGAGFVGKAHIEALRRVGVPIVGLLGSTPARTREACDELRLAGAQAYGSVEELAADPNVDVVHICTPNHVHRMQAETSLRAGKHVLCEKPLALNTEETAALVALAAEKNLVGGVAHNLRYYPLNQEARTLIQSGAIGEPRLVHGSYLQDWLWSANDWSWRLEPEVGGSLRTVADIGTHWLDLTQWLTSRKVTDLCADVATVIPVRHKPKGPVLTFQKLDGSNTVDVEITSDDYASVLLRYAGGLRGVMTVSQISAGRKNRLWWEIDGSEGSLAWDQENPNMLWLGRRDQANGSLIKDPGLMSPAARSFAAYPGGHAEGYPDTFVQLFREYYAYLEAGDFAAPRPFPTFETGHRGLVLCEAIARSSQQQAWVKLGD